MAGRNILAKGIYWAKQCMCVAIIIYITMSLLKVRLSHLHFNTTIRCSWGQRTVQLMGMSNEIAIIKDKIAQEIMQFENLKKRLINDSIQSLSEKSIEGYITYENIRRRIYSNTQELELYLNYKLTISENKTLTMKQQRYILEEASERKRSLLSDQQRLASMDGYTVWRSKEARQVSDLVQRRISYLQNPRDCPNKKKLVCHLNKNYCGFGCQIHHVVYCLIFAYATERTMILDSKDWRYFKNGWDHVFKPLSEDCTSVYNDEVVPWPAPADTKVISIPFLEELLEKPRFLPLAVPEDLASRIVKFNGDPPSWWIGQMLTYIMKPQKTLQSIINKSLASTNFEPPIVGIHVRRTDKIGVEADLHNLSEYMQEADEYFAQWELTRVLTKRRVYLATDEPRIFEEARERYPQHTFYGDPEIAEVAKKDRYTPRSLIGLLVNLHLLAMCDFFVGTFTSQISRVVYELMQANRIDASQSYVSLDDRYHFVGQIELNRILIAPNENLLNDTHNSSDIPWYKTTEQLLVYSFPEYREVPLV